MSDSYEVVTPALTTHTRALAELAATLDEALTAAKVTIARDAYGEIGTRFAKALGDVGVAGQKTLRSGIDALDTAGTAMRANVVQYDDLEAAGATAFDNVTVDTSAYSSPVAGTIVTTRGDRS